MKTAISTHHEISLIKILFLIILFILGICSCYNDRIGFIFSLVEVLAVLSCVVSGKLGLAIILHNIFLGCSTESSFFVFGDNAKIINCYAFMPIVHRYGPLFVELLLYVSVRAWKPKSMGVLPPKSKLFLFVRYTTIIVIGGFVTSAFSLLLNDNNVLNLTWFFDSYLTESVYWLIFLLDILILYEYLNRSDGFDGILRSWLINFFVAMVISSYISILSGVRGYYSIYDNIIVMPFVVFYGTLLIIFPSFKSFKESKYLYALGVLSIVSLILAPTPLMGKWILLLLYSVVLFLFLHLNKSNIISAIVATIIISFVFYGVIAKTEISDILLYKYDQAISLFTIFSAAGADDAASSPLARFDELYNIYLEYVDKPYYMLIGKGIGGSTHQWVALTNWADGSSFTDTQVSAGIFTEMHESLNIVFLKFGLCGLFWFFWVLYTVVINIKKSPWLSMGLIWFLFFINNYISMFIMIPVLLLGLYELDVNKLNTKK